MNYRNIRKTYKKDNNWIKKEWRLFNHYYRKNIHDYETGKIDLAEYGYRFDVLIGDYVDELHISAIALATNNSRRG